MYSYGGEDPLRGVAKDMAATNTPYTGGSAGGNYPNFLAANTPIPFKTLPNRLTPEEQRRAAEMFQRSRNPQFNMNDWSKSAR